MSNSQGMDRRRRKTREAILKAFLPLFFERGYEALTIGDVAAAADIGRSTLYTHFRRKEDMLRASMEGLLRGLAAAVVPGSEDELPRLAAHFWENRRHRRVFSPGPCRNVLAAALAEEIEPRLVAAPGRLPPPLAARVIADHQLNLLDRWLGAPSGVDSATLADAMRRSVGALRDGLGVGGTKPGLGQRRRRGHDRHHLAV